MFHLETMIGYCIHGRNKKFIGNSYEERCWRKIIKSDKMSTVSEIGLSEFSYRLSLNSNQTEYERSNDKIY